jgi:recombination protein RecT
MNMNEIKKSDALASMQASIQKQNQAADLNKYLQSDAVMNRLQKLVGENAEQWVSTILHIANSNKQLQQCEPKSIVAAAVQAIALRLPIDATLGYSYIVPYANKAQFQIGYKGLIQLALRSGQYRTINVSTVYEGQLVSHDILTGEVVLQSERSGNNVVGYVAYIELVNGFRKAMYMTVDEVTEHAKRFSKMYGKADSLWVKNFDGMAQKTVLKRLLSKYGLLSVDMQRAIKVDQAVIPSIESDDNDIIYIDNPDDNGNEAGNE